MSWTSTQPGAGHLTPPPSAPVQPGDTPPALSPRILAVTFQAGAPTRGSWQTGQAVIDANGSIWQCTAGGQPGTWTQRTTGVAGVASFNGRTGAVTPQPADYQGVTPGSLIGKTIYAPATEAAYNVGATLAALDTTNLTVTFSTPQSGAITARITVFATTDVAGVLWLGLVNHNTTTQIGSAQVAQDAYGSPTGDTHTGCITLDFDITGLTPGPAQLDLAAVASGTATINAQNGNPRNTSGQSPATLKIYAA